VEVKAPKTRRHHKSLPKGFAEDVVRHIDGPFNLSEYVLLAYGIDDRHTRGSAGQALRGMMKKGLVRRVGTGVYERLAEPRSVERKGIYQYVGLTKNGDLVLRIGETDELMIVREV